MKKQFATPIVISGQHDGAPDFFVRLESGDRTLLQEVAGLTVEQASAVHKLAIEWGLLNLAEGMKRGSVE